MDAAAMTGMKENTMEQQRQPEQLTPSQKKEREKKPNGPKPQKNKTAEDTKNIRKERKRAGGRKSKKKKIMLVLLAVLLVLLAVGAILYVQWDGQRKNRMKNAVSDRIVLTEREQAHLEGIEGWLEGDTVDEADRNTDRVYRYKENTINILVMGIDKDTAMSERDHSSNSVGQADTIFVASLDMDSQELRLIAVHRDTMVSLEKYNGQGEYLGVQQGQISLQYAYGDGQKQSCELMKEQVCTMLGGIPIYGYVALNMNTIPAINDAVGGVEVTMEEDYTRYDRAFKKGKTVRLKGNQVLRFIRSRDAKKEGSAYDRLMRQKTYLKAFASQAKSALAGNVQIVLVLLKELEGNFETDLNEADITYLLLQALSCQFSEDNIWVLPGTIEQGEKYEEYYLDELAVRAGVIRMFYEIES